MAKKIECYQSDDGLIFLTEAEALKQDKYLANKATLEASIKTLKTNLTTFLATSKTPTMTLDGAIAVITEMNNWLVDEVTNIEAVLK